MLVHNVARLADGAATHGVVLRQSGDGAATSFE
jgi:hypothetical protein